MWSLLLAGLLAASNYDPDSVTASRSRLPCLDTIQLQKQFEDGDLNEVYGRWLNFISLANEERLRVDRPCLIHAYRMLGILDLALAKDTMAAIRTFSRLARMDPETTLWNFSLPEDIQSFWDEQRDRWGPPLTDEELWKLKWLPPLKFEEPRDTATLRLRNTYNDNRILYGLATDPDYYVRILNHIGDLNDPAFILMRAEVMLRLGYATGKVQAEADRFLSPASRLVDGDKLVAWRQRLQTRIDNPNQKGAPSNAASEEDRSQSR